MTSLINWNELASLKKLRAVIDPNDSMGFKNMLIDRVHWLAIKRQLGTSKHVLDIGCGSGRFCQRIKAMGTDYAGIDPSSGMVEAAQEWNVQDKENFQCFDGHKIPFADNTFDTVLCARVMMHLLKTSHGDELLAEMARVLKPDGRLILLEEASLSDRKSGQAPRVLTENDYHQALHNHFKIIKTHKVRSSEFSMFARRATEIPGHMPYVFFRLILAPLTRVELWRAMRHTDDYYRKITYYDFLIRAQVLKA